jgi:hypothetical protein
MKRLNKPGKKSIKIIKNWFKNFSKVKLFKVFQFKTCNKSGKKVLAKSWQNCRKNLRNFY